jgi:predicted methyltransferase
MRFNKQLADKANVKTKTVLTQDMKNEYIDYMEERKNKGSLEYNYNHLTIPLAEKVFDHLVDAKMTATRDGRIYLTQSGKREVISETSDYDPYNMGNTPYTDNEEQIWELFHTVYCEAEHLGRIIKYDYDSKSTVTISERKVKNIIRELKEVA